MSEFEIKTGAVQNKADDIVHIATQIENIAQQCDAICSEMSSETSMSMVKAKLRNIILEVRREVAITENMGSVLLEICQMYEKCERTILNGQTEKKNIEDILKYFSEATRKLIENIVFWPGGINGKISVYDGDPVNMCTGNYVDYVEEFSFYHSLNLSFSRYYNSMLLQQGSLGVGWQHNYESYLDIGKDEIDVHWGNGEIEKFHLDKDNNYHSVFGSYDSISISGENYLYTRKNEYKYLFNTEGLLIKIFDNNQNAITFEYENGKLKTASDQYQNSIFYEYNDDGLLICVSDTTGRSINLFYEDVFLTRVQSIDEHNSIYDYDIAGRLTSYLDTNSKIIFSIYYDEYNRVIRQEFADHVILQYKYGENYVELVREDGTKITYYHDESGRHICTEFLGTKEEYCYNDQNHRTTYIDENGKNYIRYFDENGNIISFINPMGEETKYFYEAHTAEPVKMILADGEKREASYDDVGNIKTLCDECGNITEFKYNIYGQVVGIINPDASFYTFSYDEKGNLIEECDECGCVTKYYYDEYGNVKEKKSPTGISRFYTYSAAGDLLSYTNGEGNTRYYKYNERHQVIEVTDFDGYSEQWKYNRRGFLTEHIDKCGNSVEYKYDSFGNRIGIKMPNGGEIIRSFNEKNQLIKEIDLDGECTEYQYDAVGNCVTYQKGEYIIHFAYDDMGRIVRKSDNVGYSENALWNSRGNILEMNTEEGKQLTCIYDSAGRCVKQRNIYGKTTEYEYDVMGRVIKIKDENGRISSYKYNSDGTLIKSSYADGSYIEFFYDADKKIIKKKFKNGNILKYKYDREKRITQISDNLGHTIDFEYDITGNVIRKKYPNGAIYEFQYTPIGKMNYIKDPLGNEIRYEYDCMNRLIHILRGNLSENAARQILKKATEEQNVFNKDDAYHILTYEYTKGGKLASRIDQSGCKDIYEYNDYGNMIRRISQEGENIEYFYYADGKVKGIKYPDLGEVAINYNYRGQIEKIQDWNGTINFLYDKFGRITEVCDVQENIISYNWEGSNKKQSIVYPDGQKKIYQYDEITRQTGIRAGEEEIRYRYDQNGRLMEKIMPNGISEEYDYYVNGRMRELIHKDANGYKMIYHYYYDSVGRLTKENVFDEKEDLTEEKKYIYDLLNRLTEVWKNNKKLLEYQYDIFGNRVKEVREGCITNYKYNELNQLIEIQIQKGEATDNIYLKYDKRGNLISEKGKSGKKQYIYNSADQLVKFISETGESVFYQYDALGNRIKEKRKFGFQSDIREYIYDYTRDYNNILMIRHNGNDTSYLWDDHLLAENTNGKNNYYQCDFLGSVKQIYNDDGLLFEKRSYDAFGNIEQGKIDENYPFGYTGLFFNSALGAYHTYSREYRTDWGRFIRRDADQFMHLGNPESVNLYTYCLNNPIIFTDLNGEDCYIFYCPEWENEAKNDQKQLAKQYGYSRDQVHLIPINSNQDLRNGWNAMGTENGQQVDIDTVVINSHANPRVLGYEGSKDYFTTGDISQLDNKNMDNLVLYGCNAGHADYSDDNVAASFSRKVNGAPVMASDGTVSPNLTFFNITKRSYSSKGDKHYKDWLPENSKRKNNGWMIYQYENGQVNTEVLKDKKMNLTDMVKELNKRRANEGRVLASCNRGIGGH